MDKSLLKAVTTYVPAHVVRRVLAGDPPRPGEAEPIEAAVLFADVAGFTAMTERLGRVLDDRSPGEGYRASEELNRLLNTTFTALIEPVMEWGGDITRFSGDALTAYFERLPGASPGATVAGALACARAMQQAMAPLLQARVAGHEFPISVKIGLGYGPALRLTVGSAERGLESVLAGPAVDAATLAEQRAGHGQVVADPAALEWLETMPSGDDVGGASAVTAGEVQAAHGPDVARPDLDSLDPAAHERVQATLAPYLPREVYESLALTGGELPGDFRRVTSLFVGFEGIRYESPGVGPALQDYFTWAQGIVARFEGRLNRVITDDKGNVLHILFGAPGKHDDDLERALRCALAFQKDSARPALITAQRIGIASGIVLARPIGSATRREYTVIGDEVNLSSRLMTAGAPGDILVDSYTRDRTAQRFTFETLPPLQLKGKAFPVKGYRLRAERDRPTGLTARYLSSRWALAGRDGERAALLAAADQALAGRGQTIFVSGRAGVGKTRLIEEVVRHWVSQGGDGFIGQCLSHGLHSPYLPWIDLWRVFFGFHEADDPAACWKKVETVVAAEAGALSLWAGLLGAVMGLPVPESPALDALDAADRRLKLFDLVLELVRARAARQPLLLLFEDLHWADRPSLDLLDHVAAHVDDARLLMCLCARPRGDLNLQAIAAPGCTRVELEELTPESSAQMIRAVLHQADLPSAFEREIYDKTQGNPLFVEELLNSLIESGVLVPRAGGYTAVGDLTQIRVPDTLQDLLMARIDRLEPPSRDLLQVASVIDRRFAYNILHGIYPYRMTDMEMRDRLEATIQVDLTRLDHPEPELAYLFKHTMTYEVAYNSLPFARRRELHERVGDFIEMAHPDHLEQYYAVLARHFGQSERWEKMLVYALAAGSQAQEMYANDEALKYYEQAEQCLGRLPLETYWINALRLYLNRATLYRLKGQYDLCEADIRQALSLAQAHADRRAQAEAHNLLAELRWWQGRNEEVRQAAQRAYNLAKQAHSHSDALTALWKLGMAHHAMGQPDQAMTYFVQAHDLAYQHKDQVRLGVILNAIGVAYLGLERFDNALETFQRALVLLEAVDLKYHITSCLMNIGIAQFHLGQLQAALAAYQRAVAVGQAGGFQTGVAYIYHAQAEAYSYLGEYAQANAACQKAQAFFRETGDAVGLAYIQLVQAGDIGLSLGLHAQARPILESALRTIEHRDIEQARNALLYLVESHLHDNDLEAADARLRQVNGLTAPSLSAWFLPRKAWLEARLALARGDLEGVGRLTQEMERLINAGKSPDMLGPLWMLRAQAALARDDLPEVRANFERAGQATQTRSSFRHKLLVLKEAGVFLASHPDAAAAAQGRQWLEETAALQRHLEAQREQIVDLLS